MILKKQHQQITVSIQNTMSVKKMIVMSYALVVAFHPHLSLRKITAQRRYRHSLKQLTNINYLTNDQMKQDY